LKIAGNFFVDYRSLKARTIKFFVYVKNFRILFSIVSTNLTKYQIIDMLR